ncbi:bifunctional diaminohydroxyphosphoribosylaminopyrimidine deaminase/5-amino-6-(5-phosphoribosylamino)uracil reductase RibD [Arhodomonas aquaeolei]|uniref:bifunctional diaminohydroxyphosphoribosylaminopyrimidine deaminase/5-amino-6-(5-phosphoribosylamino)uracil reductase RibD n=1 Tax=Arhodomonas aquaeolei TaxID=2369 RepID=UPI002167CE39|nr:bifunctional diaminohydroxyphosphoribosylaminopyrimidine deaminase/5-amino-6-(5-phosphoribosylamino)uracil reductase RibD [Arhodomonas aquaeolei]MCS4503378.1 bifunctional diaminohydroxyphosphoribosylaminopyrimidine deaminase/5-amino-6-(5-phosphoribosylamino)uracil reductase RibD [Arhodomonas aquaeolei]
MTGGSEPGPGSFSATDHALMARAIRLARRGLYTTDPNPRVGCVIARAGEIVGEGWHERAGGPHAEVHALRAAGAAAHGATAYVTLEPCAHHGRTPPCADALAEAGVARVVVAGTDPNPAVAGGGLERLRGAGVDVAAGLMAAQARGLNPGFLRRMAEGMPWVWVKLAASLDGRTAMASGESRWITGAPARRDVHRWRARSSAMLTGIGTVLADDPALTVRDVDAPVVQPARYVIDPSLRLPETARLVTDGGGVTVFCSWPDDARVASLEAAGARVVPLPPDPEGRPVLTAVLAAMARDGVNEVMVEAGPTLAGAVVAAGLADELIVYYAPHLMGDAARGLLVLPELEAMADRIPLRVTDRRQVGDDLRLVLAPAGEG